MREYSLAIAAEALDDLSTVDCAHSLHPATVRLRKDSQREIAAGRAMSRLGGNADAAPDPRWPDRAPGGP